MLDLEHIKNKIHENLKEEINHCNKLWSNLNELNSRSKCSSSIYLEIKSNLQKSSLKLSKISDVIENLDSAIHNVKSSSLETLSFIINLRNMILENEDFCGIDTSQMLDPELKNLALSLKAKNKSVEGYLSEIDQQLEQLSKELSLTKSISQQNSKSAKALISKNLEIITEKINEEFLFLDKQIKVLTSSNESKPEITTVMKMLNNIKLESDKFQENNKDSARLSRDNDIFSTIFAKSSKAKIEEYSEFSWSLKIVKSDVKCIKEIKNENFFKVAPCKPKTPIIENPQLNTINRRTSEKLLPMISGINRGIQNQEENSSKQPFLIYNSPARKEENKEEEIKSIVTLPKSPQESKPPTDSPNIMIHHGQHSVSKSETPKKPVLMNSPQEKSLSPLVTNSTEKVLPKVPNKGLSTPTINVSPKLEPVLESQGEDKAKTPTKSIASPGIAKPTENVSGSSNLFGSMSLGQEKDKTTSFSSSLFGSLPETTNKSPASLSTSSPGLMNILQPAKSIESPLQSNNQQTPTKSSPLNNMFPVNNNTASPQNSNLFSSLTIGGKGSPSQPAIPVIFGAQSVAPSPVASTTSSGLFGQVKTTPSSSSSIFSPSIGTTTANTGSSLFGSTNLFQSNTTTSSLANNSSGSGLFSTQKVNTTTNTGGLFGTQNANTTPSGSGLFGTQNANTTPSGGGLFGTQKANTTPSGSGLFGTQNANTTPSGGGLFGTQKANTTPSGGNLFGFSASPGQQTTGSKSGLFSSIGQVPQQTSNNLFGASNQKSVGLFGGSPSTGTIGGSAGSGGGSGLFGSSPSFGSGSSGLFGQSASPLTGSNSTGVATGGNGLFGGVPGGISNNTKSGLFSGSSNQGNFSSFNQIANNNSAIPTNNIFGNSPSFTQRRA